MLSCITVSRDPSRVARLRASLEATFADRLPFDLQVLDGTQHDLFSGYNAGAEQARHPFLMFVHDDVELLGNVRAFQPVFELLKRPLTGVVGVAGTRLLPASATWWQSPQEECRGMAGHPDGQGGLHWNVWPWGAGQFGRVAVLDGVLLLCRSTTWKQLGGFDGTYYGGFHFYDLDFTFRATRAGLQNHAVPLPLHHSHGETNAGWEENRRKFLARHSQDLPYQVR